PQSCLRRDGLHRALPSFPTRRSSDLGTVYVYRGVKDGQPSRDVVTVMHRTKLIAGVPCVVVEDRLYLRGRLGERTTDWYTQDKQDRKSTRLNYSHVANSYARFCLKKK